jgi:hypothetical protein
MKITCIPAIVPDKNILAEYISIFLALYSSSKTGQRTKRTSTENEYKKLDY